MPGWLVVLLAICLVAAGALVSVVTMRALPGLALFGTESESSNTQIVNAVTREQQVVLLSLGIQGIATKSENKTYLGLELPGSERTTFLRYEFKAKLGIDGKDVRIAESGDNEYLIAIPRFIFIGHSDENFKTAAESNGALSWLTPQIDKVEMVNRLLTEEAQAQYIASNQAILRDQATAFYTGVIAAVDPTITVRFEFDE
jgi:hypothetical protein